MNHARRSIAIMLTLVAILPALSQAASLQVLEQRRGQREQCKAADPQQCQVGQVL